MRKQNKFRVIAIMAIAALTFAACSKDDDNQPEPIREGIERSELILTEVSGDGVYPHGDHFHGLNDAVAGESIVIKFNENGEAIENGHLHLEVDAVYKVELKAWDYNGQEVQNSFVASKAIADEYKAFLVGGNFVLNPDSQAESGAIFQPREQQYGDGTAVNGQFETTGVLSYFGIGHDNEGPTKEVSYVMRKLNSGVKSSITRIDWNRNDYAEAFAGENVLELRFEVHAEAGHSH